MNILFLLCIIISSFLVCIIFLGSWITTVQNNVNDKGSIYECGFNPIDDSRQSININFFLVALLFLIFDLEISLIFPFSLCINYGNILSYWNIIIFLNILSIGLFLEWKKGGLEWNEVYK